MINDSIDAKDTRAKALGTRAQGRKPWVQGHKTSDVLACWGLGIVATGILNTFLTIK